MTRKLICISGLFCQMAQAQSYTKCAVSAPDLSNTSPFCSPTANDTLALDVSGNNPVIVVVPAKNCRPTSAVLYGSTAIVVDSSGSLVTTDPDNARFASTTQVLSDLHRKAGEQGSGVPASAVDYPKVGVVSYVGRSAVLAASAGSDPLNPVTTPIYCTDGDGLPSGEQFPASIARWSAVNSSNQILSFCEFLRPTRADMLGSATNTAPVQPGVDRNSEFLKQSGINPRGATDISYFFESINRNEMLGTANLARTKTAIVITDGLPNVPKKVAPDICAATPHLSKEPILTDSQGRPFCYDRNFRQAKTVADVYLDQNPEFRKINVYNALFAPKDAAYYDTDTYGDLNPADFLIESSARTGNGKVKFKYARSSADLSSWIDSILTNTNQSALQRVEVTIGTQTKYNAVSPGGNGQEFSVKLVGLAQGTNTVLLDYVYSDSTVRRTMTVNVTAQGGVISSPYQCTTTDGTNKTVDGDLVTELDPRGDGVLPFPKRDGTQAGDRVLRNNDINNKLSNQVFRSSVNSTPTTKDMSKYRLQGGTGNCGVISANPSGKSNAPMILLLLSPMAFAVGSRRKKQ